MWQALVQRTDGKKSSQGDLLWLKQFHSKSLYNKDVFGQLSISYAVDKIIILS